MHPIIVYLLTDDPSQPRVSLVEALFLDSRFRVKIVTIDPLPNTVTGHVSNEINRIKWCLNDADKNYRQNHLVIVNDTAVSDMSPQEVAQLIRTAADSDSSVTQLNEDGPVSGLLISPEGRELLLGKKVKNGKRFNIQERAFEDNLQAYMRGGALQENMSCKKIFKCKKRNQRRKSQLSLNVTEQRDNILNEINSVRDTNASSIFPIWVFIILVIILLIAGFLALRY
jgi:hypothetical protein